MRWLTFIHESRESFGYVTSDGQGIVDVGARGIYDDLKAMIAADGGFPDIEPMVPADLSYWRLTGGDPAESRSDHASFQAHGYAACLCSEDFFAGPRAHDPQAEANPNYHKKSDTFIDPTYAANISRVVAAAAWTMA